MTLRNVLGFTALAALAAASAVAAQPAPPAAPQVLAPTVAPPPPPPPPTGEAASVISLLEKGCIPLIKKQDIKAVAAANGLKHSHDQWVLQLQGVQRIFLDPPSTANPTVCTLTVNHEIDQAQPIIDALTGWASTQAPPLAPLGAGFPSSPGVKGWSWAADAGEMHEGLVLSVQKTPDGKPVGHGYDVSTILFSLSGAQ